MGMVGSSGLFAPPPLWAAEQQMGIGGLTPSTSFSGGLDHQDQAAAAAGNSGSTPGAPGAANGFHHSLFPFQLPGEASAGEPAHPPAIGAGAHGGKPPRAGGVPGPGVPSRMGAAAAGNDPFNSTESLARLLGLSLPETPDSLAAQARGAHGGPVPGVSLGGGSRYAFAKEGAGGDMAAFLGHHGGGGGGLFGPGAAAAAAPGHGHGHQKRGSGGGSRGGNGLHGQPGHYHRPSASSGGLDSSLQSSMALLQQLLPNCNLTYGDGAKEELGVSGSGGGGGGGRVKEGKGGRLCSPGALL
jgi:hypothetical protein